LAIAEDPNLVTQKSTVDLFAVLYFLQNFDEISSEIARTQDLAINRPVTEAPRFDQYYQAIADQTKKLLINCTVRTLPMFNRKAFRQKSCTLEGYTGGMIGQPEKLKKPAPYNGTYSVLGFKHVISPNNIYSEFDLLREGFSSKLQKSDVSVKEYLCDILKRELPKLKLDEDPSYEDKDGLFTRIGKDIVGGFRSLFDADYAKERSAQVKALNREDGRAVNKEYFARIERALKVMGCKD